MSAQLSFENPLPGVSPEVYNAANFSAVAKIAHAEAGIVLGEGKAMLVYSRLAPLVRESGLNTFSDFLAHVHKDEAAKARTVAALTTNHTFFFRESHHFEFFENETRPALLKQLSDGDAVRIWSAGCSSGEETWSLIMTLLGKERSEGRSLVHQDLRVLASDLAPHAIEAASAARYPTSDLKAVPADLRNLWTSNEEGMSTIAKEARSIVRFRLLNLLGQWPISKQFDVIFCRNVMIYFDNPTKERLISRFVDALVPGGHIFIGHSERVTGPAVDQLVPVGPTIYQKKAHS